ncbi:MAG: hypothetical protein B7Y30_08360, partial [Campylobacterales bacterium 16-40-21]
DFIELFVLITLYPFKTLRLLQNENIISDKIFNQALIEDIKNSSFDSFTRYIFGKKIADLDSVERIYSWSEFQVIERSFNFGIRKNNERIKIIACQFYLNYEIYFNAYADDLDYEMLSAPHQVLVNGKYYLQHKEKISYRTGVSLRYKDIFEFQEIKKEINIILLGSYIEQETKNMLENMTYFDNIIFKNHPAVDITKFGKLPKNITVSDENIYTLFENAKLIIGTASGTLVEAVACGVSVIVIASKENLTANPLVKYGQGQIWDIAFEANDIERIFTQLIAYRENNRQKIQTIRKYYKDNFFIPLTDENIRNTFGFYK